MSAWKIVLVECAMISLIFLALCLVPERTPLRTFLAVASELLLIGNYLSFKPRANAEAESPSRQSFSWMRLLKVFILLNGVWVLGELLGV
jgi:hypothetical protein